MAQSQEPFNEMDSLRIIGSMINTARNQMTDNGHLYLLWGWVVLVCSAGQFLMQHVLHIGNHWIIWILTWVAIIYQIFYLRRHEKKKRVRSYMDEIIKYVWIVFSILMILMAFILVRIVRQPEYINLVILVLYGMPTFLSGIILKFRPLVVGAIGCWVLSLLSLFITPQYYTLLLSAAVIIAWIVPGYLLQSKYKKENTAS
ncbi:MAG: hypothetical protein V4722_24860 [Bacteroidota bacterium]